jgi:ketosteroid isomerase-like protein
MTTDTEALVRRACHFAQGDVVIQPTGAKVNVPCADFWYVRDGKIKEFNCYVSVKSMLAQIGVLPDFASVVASSTPAQ